MSRSTRYDRLNVAIYWQVREIVVALETDVQKLISFEVVKELYDSLILHQTEVGHLIP
jgi:hypothetical protein